MGKYVFDKETDKQLKNATKYKSDPSKIELLEARYDVFKAYFNGKDVDVTIDKDCEFSTLGFIAFNSEDFTIDNVYVIETLRRGASYINLVFDEEYGMSFEIGYADLAAHEHYFLREERREDNMTTAELADLIREWASEYDNVYKFTEDYISFAGEYSIGKDSKFWNILNGVKSIHVYKVGENSTRIEFTI